MLQVHDKNRFHADGTPRRKYEIDESADARNGFRVAVGLAVTATISFVKNVVWGTPTATASDPTPAASSDRKPDMSSSEMSTASVEFAAAAPEEAEKARSSDQSGADHKGLRGKSASFIDASSDYVRKLTAARANDNHQATQIGEAGAKLDRIAFTLSEPQLVVGGDGGGGSARDPSNPDRETNRRPQSSGLVALGTVFFNAHLALSLADLLSKSTDSDGDRLTVTSILASSGTLTDLGDGTWHFLPTYNDARPVTFVYEVSDGESSYWQEATLTFATPSLTFSDGTSAIDELAGTIRSDVINGGDGNDRILGRDGGDVIIAGAGDDLIYGGNGNDLIYAGAGADTVFGGNGNDIIYGEAGADSLHGEAGNDVLSGGDGDDLLVGGEGDDVLLGDAHHDTIIDGEGNDRVDGGSGNDRLVASLGNDVIDGGTGIDTLDASTSMSSLTVDLAAGTASGLGIGSDQIANIENVTTGSGHDTVTGSATANVIDAGAGNDTINAGSGADIIAASSGSDIIDGGDHVDTYDARSATASVVVDLAAGTAHGTETGTDTLCNIENVETGSGADTVTGSAAANVINTGAGNDRVVASSGGDIIDAGTGTDTYDAGHVTQDLVVNLRTGTVAAAPPPPATEGSSPTPQNVATIAAAVEAPAVDVAVANPSPSAPEPVIETSAEP
ncbi:MAG: hypothetical protein RL291_758, partial [Pseudomonadota bacterium]